MMGELAKVLIKATNTAETHTHLMEVKITAAIWGNTPTPT